MIFNLKNILSKTEIVDLIYPIGSIYISINSTSPATLFGGTWQQIEGAFLLAANTEYPAGTIGGEAQHQLTISEMPKHGHSMSGNGLGWYDYGDSSNGVNRWWFNVNGTVGAFGQMNAKRGIIPGWGGGDTNSIVNIMGNSQPHNNMPHIYPYICGKELIKIIKRRNFMTIFDIDILTGLKPIAAVYLGFTIVYLLNMMGGIIINCQITKEETFSFGKLFLSFEKVIFCGITLGGLVISTNLVTQGLFTINNELTEIVTSVISLGIFALVFAKGFIQKALDLVSKIKYLFEITDTSEQTNLDNINSLALENLNNYIDTATEPGNSEPLG